MRGHRRGIEQQLDIRQRLSLRRSQEGHDAGRQITGDALSEQIGARQIAGRMRSARMRAVKRPRLRPAVGDGGRDMVLQVLPDAAAAGPRRRCHACSSSSGVADAGQHQELRRVDDAAGTGAPRARPAPSFSVAATHDIRRRRRGCFSNRTRVASAPTSTVRFARASAGLR